MNKFFWGKIIGKNAKTWGVVVAILCFSQALAQTENPAPAQTSSVVVDNTNGPYFGVRFGFPFLLGAQAGLPLDQNIDLRFTVEGSFLGSFNSGGVGLANIALDGIYYVPAITNDSKIYLGLGAGVLYGFASGGGGGWAWDIHTLLGWRWTVTPTIYFLLEVTPIYLIGTFNGVGGIQVFAFPVFNLGWQFRV